MYRDVFAHYAGWDWERVREEAARYVAPVTAFEPRYLEEIRGLAEGAGLGELDVMAINVRTEIMFAATSRAHRGAECTSFAVVPSRTGEGTLLIGQNWDWIPDAAERRSSSRPVRPRPPTSSPWSRPASWPRSA